jgi:DNA transformation protein
MLLAQRQFAQLAEKATDAALDAAGMRGIGAGVFRARLGERRSDGRLHGGQLQRSIDGRAAQFFDGAAADHVDCGAGVRFIGMLLECLAPGRETVEQFGADVERLRRRAGHDQLLILPHFPQSAEVVTADGGLLILHEDDLAAGLFETDADGLLSAAMDRVAQRADLREFAREVLGDVEGVVGRAIIDNEDFESLGQLGDELEPTSDLPGQRRLTVAHGEDQAQGVVQEGPRLRRGHGGKPPCQAEAHPAQLRSLAWGRLQTRGGQRYSLPKRLIASAAGRWRMRLEWGFHVASVVSLVRLIQNKRLIRFAPRSCAVPVSQTFRDFVRDQLALSVPGLRDRRMFGAIGIYARDLFFALLDNDRLYLKVDDSNRADFIAAGMGPFQPFGDDRMTMQYYEVPLEVIENSRELATWAAKAIEVARMAAVMKSKPKKRARPTPKAKR